MLRVMQPMMAKWVLDPCLCGSTPRAAIKRMLTSTPASLMVAHCHCLESLGLDADPKLELTLLTIEEGLRPGLGDTRSSKQFPPLCAPAVKVIAVLQGHCCLVLCRLLFGLELDQLQNKGIEQKEHVLCLRLDMTDDISVLGPRKAEQMR